MSDLLGRETHCTKYAIKGDPAIQFILEPEEKDLGGALVRRLLPSKQLSAVGPFVFFDHLGPAEFPPGEGLDVRPHPHIGLATITYVFAGEILHRDSLGSVQPIRPNEINWMTAGKGIVHSERTAPQLRQKGHRLEALQLWVALPTEQEQTDPCFAHYAAEALPVQQEQGRLVRVLIGEAYGLKSAVKTLSPTLYVAVELDAGATINVPENVQECAVYIVSGSVTAENGIIPTHAMAVLAGRSGSKLRAREATRLVFVGGTPLGKRTVWWNLVASRKELIEQAKAAWRNGAFPQVPGETDFIPLPE